MEAKIKREIIKELNLITSLFARSMEDMRDPELLFDEKLLNIWYDGIVSLLNPGTYKLYEYCPKLHSALEELAIQMFQIPGNLFEIENIVKEEDGLKCFKFRGIEALESSGVFKYITNVFMEIDDFIKDIKRDLLLDNKSFIKLSDVTEAIYLYDLSAFYTYSVEMKEVDKIPSYQFFEDRANYYDMSNVHESTNYSAYLTRDVNNNILYEKDGSMYDVSSYICVKNFKYVERFKSINSQDSIFGFGKCDPSQLTDWHFGKSNIDPSQVKKEEKRTKDTSKNKKKKEKKKKDFSWISKILPIIAYPFIKIWEGLKFIGKIFKKLFLNIKNWFEDTFLFNRMLDKTILGSKGKREKNKSSKYKKERKGFKFKLPKISLKFNPVNLLFLIPVIVCFIVFIGFDNNWFNLEFFKNLNSNINFVSGYGNWAKVIGDWLEPAMEDLGTIQNLLAFILILPLSLIAYILEGIWWLISWVIIGIIKLLVFLIGNIIFIIPILLYIASIVMDVIMFIKNEEKDLLTCILFALSLLGCIVFGVIIIF